MTETFKMDIQAIMRLLPHRYPFLLVDRVLECAPGKHVHALKNVSFNEPFFPGHFPHRPIMPGVLIVEALAQVAGILAFTTAKVTVYTDAHFYFVGIDKARFRKPVEPGDQLILKVTLTRALRGIWKFDGVAEVEGAEVASAELMVAPEINPRRTGTAPETTPPTPTPEAAPDSEGDAG
jgi:3-hydroxyacyl-[acyl-carrier-protein] dehydratase